MSRGSKGRPVYSTEHGRACPDCGWPEDDCRCSSNLEQPVPEEIVASLTIERSGRRGKTVTVIHGLPRNEELLKETASELKRACGAGGSYRDDRIEIQGDQREAVRPLLEKKGWRIKG